MVRVKVLMPVIYKGRAYNVGDIFDCDGKSATIFEKRGIVARLLTEGGVGGEEVGELGELVPVDGLPTLEDEQKTKGKKK